MSQEDKLQDDKQKLPERAKEKVARARQHLRDNRKVYLVGAGCFAAGYLLRQPRVITIVNHTAPAITPIFNNHNIGNVVNTVVHNGSYARKIIRCVETDELWPSMSKAAEAAGHSIQRLSDQIHGRTDHLDGLHYVIEGLAAN